MLAGNLLLLTAFGWLLSPLALMTLWLSVLVCTSAGPQPGSNLAQQRYSCRLYSIAMTELQAMQTWLSLMQHSEVWQALQNPTAMTCVLQCIVQAAPTTFRGWLASEHGKAVVATAYKEHPGLVRHTLGSLPVTSMMEHVVELAGGVPPLVQKLPVIEQCACSLLHMLTPARLQALSGVCPCLQTLVHFQGSTCRTLSSYTSKGLWQFLYDIIDAEDMCVSAVAGAIAQLPSDVHVEIMRACVLSNMDASNLDCFPNRVTKQSPVPMRIRTTGTTWGLL